MTRVLTPRTSLENLKKDAKRWLKALRAGDSAARSRLSAAWPDAPAEPVLRDVQQAVARDYGCANWVALKAAIEDLSRLGKTEAERLDKLLRHGWDGDAVVARRILQRHPELARHNLFTAAVTGDLAEVERQLAPDPGAAGKTGGSLDWTALAYVAYGRLDPENGPAIARRLLAAGADPNFRFDDGWGNAFSPLAGAIRLGEGSRPSHPQVQELLDLLIDAGADPYDFQALYNISLVGADTHWYGVLWAYCEAQGGTGKWLDNSLGAKVNDLSLNAVDYLLGSAVGQNHLARAEWLLARGADPNTLQGYRGITVHALAQLSGYLKMVALLERHGAKPSPLQGVEALQAACLRGDKAAAHALLAAEPQLIEDPRPLLAAGEFGNASAVGLLLSMGASAMRPDEEGITPLHRAVQSGLTAAVDLLVTAGAEVDVQERRWNGTPLTWAVVLGQPAIAERLAPLSRDARTLGCMGALDRLEAVLREDPRRANETLPDENGPTPLFCLPADPDLAAKVARVLLRHGADPGHKNGKGLTPAEVVREFGLEEAADLMEGKAIL